MNDAATLKSALKGAYAVYGVTNYWESHSADVEMEQGKAMADAAKVCAWPQESNLSNQVQRQRVYNILFGVLSSMSLNVSIHHATYGFSLTSISLQGSSLRSLSFRFQSSY